MVDRCALCPNQNACIPADGPQQRGGILFCGEAPGPTEDREAKKRGPGTPFIGKTGAEVNEHYLPLAGLKREEVTFDNAISCFPVSAGGKLDANRKKDLDLLDCCARHHLYPLIERMRPRLLIPLGSFAVHALCPEVNLELLHGFPVETEWGIPAFPMNHPALGLHSPKQMLYIRTDWQRLRKYLNGTLVVAEDAYPEPDYREVEEAHELLLLDPERPLACDTESGREGPFCLTYSQQPGTGRLIRAERKDLLQIFQVILKRHRSKILFHNWLYDWVITEEMGLSFPHERMVDTMVLVYHLGNLPQGLKALATRELGMEMQDFDDVVTPHSRLRVLDFYERAAAIQWPKPEPDMVRDADGRWKLYKPQGMNTKLKRFFTDLKNQPNKDMFSAWGNWDESHAMMEEQLGPWPGKDIRHVPFEDALFYACRDSDALIRLYDLLRRMPRVVRRFSQEHWVFQSQQPRRRRVA